MRRFIRDNGLSLTVSALALLCLIGQFLSGQRAFNADEREHGRPEVTLGQYLWSSHFGEATSENLESEFLQMAAYVWLTSFLFQRGSAESNDPDGQESSRPPPDPRRIPWAARRKGAVRWLYERSLSLAFALLFLVSFSMHVLTGAARYSAEQVAHGEPAVSASEYLFTSQLWFESFQNWQSEFVAILSMVVLSIFLRQQHSPESKEVERPHSETGA